MSTNKISTTKSKAVKKGFPKNENVQQGKSFQIDKLVKKLAVEISNEVVNQTVRKAVASTEFTKDLVSVSVRSAVRSSEVLKKYPPLPDNIRKLAEPTTATYIALYNKHCNVLKPKTVGSVKVKIAEYLQKIEEISLQNEHDKAAQIEIRKKRKAEAREIQKEKEFAKFCDEKCDELFSLILNKFSQFFATDREIPKPLILGPSSLELYKSIREQMTKLIRPEKTAQTAKTTDAVEPTANKPISAVGTPKRKVDIKKDVDNATKATDKKNGSGGSDAVAVDSLVKETGDAENTSGNAELMEIVDRLSYFIMEFVQNSMIEAV